MLQEAKHPKNGEKLLKKTCIKNPFEGPKKTGKKHQKKTGKPHQKKTEKTNQQ